MPNPAAVDGAVSVVRSAVPNPTSVLAPAALEHTAESVPNPAAPPGDHSSGGRPTRRRRARLRRDERGRAVRPWEVKVAAILGLISPIFIVIAILWSTFLGGRTLRWLGFLLLELGDWLDWQVVSVAGDVATTLSQILLGIGVAAGALVVVAFVVYAWRVHVGRGHARWIALGVLVVALLVVMQMSPLLIACFLLTGTASVVFAFLPRSSAWFAERRSRAARSRSER